MKNETKILIFVVCIIAFGAIFFRKSFQNKVSVELTAKNALYAVASFMDIVRSIYNAGIEEQNSISEFPLLFARDQIYKTYLKRMCDIQLRFGDLRVQLLKNNSIYIEKLISLCDLLVEYCEELARKRNSFINQEAFDNWSFARLEARVDKEIDSLQQYVRDIFIENLKFLTYNEKLALRDHIKRAFSNTIEKFEKEYSEAADYSSVKMYKCQWPIVEMYLCISGLQGINDLSMRRPGLFR